MSRDAPGAAIGRHGLNAVRRWLASPLAQRVTALLGAGLLIVLACNPDLLPLLPLVDALGLDVLALLLGAQLLGTLPWLRVRAGRWADMAGRLACGVVAGAAGGYLRALGCFHREQLAWKPASHRPG